MTGELKDVECQAPERRAADALSILAETSEGAISVDRDARITWISPRYVRLLGLEDEPRIIGRAVEEVIPESRLREVVETGRPLVLDVMRFGDQHFVVCRVPLRDARGEIDGAAGFVFFDRVDYLRPIIDKFQALEARLTRTRAALARERTAKYRLSNFIGVSASTRALKARARQFAGREGAVLILGETGVGKELLAHALHLASGRSSGPFVAVNMAAVPETLLESEFFGVAPGAFTGAERRARPGKFELAHRGTLFLDEIGDMPLAIQAKFLRVLQEGEFEALGSNQVKQVEVRIIAATSQDLEAAVADGRFREDLYYRLAVLPIRVPPLRDRLEDIDALCERILEDISPAGAPGSWLLSDEALAALKRHSWPGNVRELRNVLERATAETSGSFIDQPVVMQALGEGMGRHAHQETPIRGQVQTLAEAVADAERVAIRQALEAAGGAKSQAAALLGISRSQLYAKLKLLQTTPE